MKILSQVTASYLLIKGTFLIRKILDYTQWQSLFRVCDLFVYISCDIVVPSLYYDTIRYKLHHTFIIIRDDTIHVRNYNSILDRVLVEFM